MKKVMAVSKIHYRGHDLVETERDGKPMIEMVFYGREYLFESLPEATGFLDAAAAVKSRIVVLNETV